MRIVIACPAPPRSMSGNRMTALRWARILRMFGQRVTIAQEWRPQACDLMIALHARKSHPAIAAYRQAHPAGPLVVCLTGTDLYHDLPRSRAAQESLDWADRIVVLQKKALDELRPEWRRKTRVIRQSLPAVRKRLGKAKGVVQVCVLAHLREEKDPLRAGLALAHLPADIPLRIVHAGRALTPAWELRARGLMQKESRYRWLGELPRGRARRLLAQSHALVVSSLLEGGANVVSEAIVLGVPVLASDIPGNRGLLGDDYPGYYPVQDSRALAELLRQSANEPAFLKSLVRHIKKRQKLFRPENERLAWQALLSEITKRPKPSGA